MTPNPDEWETVRSVLRDADVGGVADFGRFVNNTQFFEPSRFDEVAAAPHLVALLPRLSDGRVVATIGRHLQNKAIGKRYYEAVLEAFKVWAARPGETGWVLGDTLARMADKSRAQDFLDLAVQREYGSSRAFVVDALWRFKALADVEPTLRALIRDPDVSVYAMTALQRTVGAAPMAQVLRDLIASGDDEAVLAHARRKLKRLERKITNT